MPQEPARHQILLVDQPPMLGGLLLEVMVAARPRQTEEPAMPGIWLCGTFGFNPAADAPQRSALALDLGPSGAEAAGQQMPAVSPFENCNGLSLL